MSDPVVGIFLGVASVAPILIGVASMAVANSNGAVRRKKILSLRQTYMFFALMAIACGALVAVAFIGGSHFGNDFFEKYLGYNFFAVVVSVLMLCHAALRFKA